VGVIAMLPRGAGVFPTVGNGVIWVYGVGEDRVKAFTDFGIENLIQLIKLTRKTPNC